MPKNVMQFDSGILFKNSYGCIGLGLFNELLFLPNIILLHLLGAISDLDLQSQRSKENY